MKAAPDNASAHFQLGIAADRTGDKGRAEDEFREAVRLRPNLLPAQRILASIAVRKSDFDLLDQTAEAILRYYPALPDGYDLRAMVESAHNHPDKAEADLAKAIEVAPHNSMGYAKMGEWNLSHKKLAEAQKMFEQALQYDPNAQQALEGLVSAYMQQKQLNQALARVTAQISKSPDNSSYYQILANLQADNKDWAGAQNSLNKAIQLDKKNATAYLALAQIETSQKAYDQAAATYQSSIENNPNDARAYIMLGSLENDRGNWQKAEALYQKAMQVQPDSAVAANNLAFLMLQRGGNVDMAVSLAQTARRGMPDSPNTADTLAWAYYQKGSYRLAIGLLEDAIKKAPENAMMQYHLGMAYQKVNDTARARMHLQKALQIDPKSTMASDAQKALTSLDKS